MTKTHVLPEKQNTSNALAWFPGGAVTGRSCVSPEEQPGTRCLIATGTDALVGRSSRWMSVAEPKPTEMICRSSSDSPLPTAWRSAAKSFYSQKYNCYHEGAHDNLYLCSKLARQPSQMRLKRPFFLSIFTQKHRGVQIVVRPVTEGPERLAQAVRHGGDCLSFDSSNSIKYTQT